MNYYVMLMIVIGGESHQLTLINRLITPIYPSYILPTKIQNFFFLTKISYTYMNPVNIFFNTYFIG